MRGKSMEVPVHQQLTHHPMKLQTETSHTQSNPVKPGQTNGVLEYWSIGEKLNLATHHPPPFRAGAASRKRVHSVQAVTGNFQLISVGAPLKTIPRNRFQPDPAIRPFPRPRSPFPFPYSQFAFPHYDSALIYGRQQ